MTDCSICCNAFTKLVRKPIVCCFCSASYCSQCCRQYILSSIQDAHCMNCRTKWTDEFLSENFSHNFVSNDYEVSRARLKMNEEKQRLPETQIIISMRKMTRMIYKEQEMFNSATRNFNTKLLEFRNSENPVRIRNEDFTMTQQKIITHTDKIKQIQNEFFDLQNDLAQMGQSYKQNGKTTHQPNIIGKCPMDTCRGFISQKGKCMMCDSAVCTKCMQKMTDTHECKEEDIATITLLRKDSKQCPNCHVYIHRYEGCPQMFCTHCHIGFDWNSGQILKKLHNPHLTEWMMSNRPAGQHHQEQCDVVNLGLIAKKLGPCTSTTRFDVTVRHFFDRSEHFRTYVIPELTRNNDTKYTSLRERYILNQLTDDQWVQEIKMLRRIENKSNDIAQVLDLFCNANTDILLQYQQDVIKTGSDLVCQLTSLKNIVNDKLASIEKRLKITCTKYKV